MAATSESDGNGWLPELFDDGQWRRLAECLRLPPRQAQIARLVCRGCSNRQIALHLSIAPDTVRMHLRVLFERLNIHERVGVVVRLALAEGQRVKEEQAADQRG